MPNSIKGYRPIKIQLGDTISTICVQLLPKASKAQRARAWHSFYRWKMVSGKMGFVPVDDINRIYAGETLYFRVTPKGEPVLKDERPKLPSDFSNNADGVVNASPVTLTPAETLSIKKDLEQARQFMDRAIAAIGQMNKRTQQTFD